METSLTTELNIHVCRIYWKSTYCHCSQVIGSRDGTSISLDGASPRASLSICLPLDAMSWKCREKFASASHTTYRIISVTLSSLASAICISVGKHSGVFVIGTMFAGSSVRFFKAWMADSLSSWSYACRILTQRAVNRFLEAASSWRQGTSSEKFWSAKQTYLRLSSLLEYEALTSEGASFGCWKIRCFVFPRWRVRLAMILQAYSCELLSTSLATSARASTRFSFLASRN